MSYQNTRSTLANGYDAAVSFTTQLEWTNHDSGAIQVVWSGINANNGTVRLRATVDGSSWCNLTTDPTTLTVSSGNQVFNFTGGDIGFESVQVVYVAASNTVGTITATANRKSLR